MLVYQKVVNSFFGVPCGEHEPRMWPNALNTSVGTTPLHRKQDASEGRPPVSVTSAGGRFFVVVFLGGGFTYFLFSPLPTWGNDPI